MRLLSLAACAGCLAAPPDATDPPGGDGGGQDCLTHGFDDPADFDLTVVTGCRIEVDGRVRFIQEASVNGADGCYAEPKGKYDTRWVEIDYGGESEVQVSLVVYDDTREEIVLSRWGTTFNLEHRNPEQGQVDSIDLDFEQAWRLWRIDWTGEETVVSAGPNEDEMDERFWLPFKLPASDIGLVIGSWPGELPDNQREVSFDDLEICP